jgi:rhodanese-related sulfurtransferase
MKTIISFAAAILLAFGASAAEPKNITIDEAANIISKDTNVVVLDIRTPKEFQGGHIRGATNIDFRDKEFAKRIQALDKSKTYIIHCQAGGRSGSACEQVKGLDFKNMLHMKQGYGAWEKAGKPVEK